MNRAPSFFFIANNAAAPNSEQCQHTLEANVSLSFSISPWFLGLPHGIF